MQDSPARIGDQIDEIDTPALIIDLDAFKAALPTADLKAELVARARAVSRGERGKEVWPVTARGGSG